VDKIGSKPVRCPERDVDRYGRIVAICDLGELDLGAWLVSEGWALDDARYSGGEYASEQAEAQQHQRGMWRGSTFPALRRMCRPAKLLYITMYVPRNLGNARVPRLAC
jgi:endonuclease YncB( thermonuclease family)